MYLLLRNHLLLLVFVLCTLTGLSQSKPSALPPAPQAALSYTLWLLGDTGEPGWDSPGKIQWLKPQLAKADTNSAVVFLGNTFYPTTLPKVNDPRRASAETRLKIQLEPLKNYRGKIMLLPGDYGKKNKNSADYHHQERFIAAFLGRDQLIQPDTRCPGPLEMHLNDEVLLLLVDTKYMMPDNILPEEGSGCEITKPAQVLAQIDDILRTYPEKQVVVAAHVSPSTGGLKRTACGPSISTVRPMASE